MKITEIHSRTVLSPSKVYDYAVNPYVGCGHGCLYCYARFMRKYSGHKEPWGDFVDVKINAPELLLEEVKRKRKGKVWVSGVCDPYQPLEQKYRLTARCLEILVRYDWPVIIQTRSPLVLRDLDILREAEDLQTGLSITTADEKIRKIFEPNTPPVMDRIRTVDELHRNNIRTYAMIAPILPGADKLPGILEGKVDYIMVDRMNYHYADWVYERHGLNDRRTDSYFRKISSNIAAECERLHMECRLVY